MFPFESEEEADVPVKDIQAKGIPYYPGDGQSFYSIQAFNSLDEAHLH